MSLTTPDGEQSVSTRISRRTMVKGAAWSLPVVAAAVATPLAAASDAPATLAYNVTPLVDVEAPFGSVSINVINTGTVDYSGPITFSTPTYATTAPFGLDGTAPTTTGGGNTWTVPSVSVAAGKATLLTLTWPGPYPLTAETQPLTAFVDPAAGTILPSGTTLVTSPYQLLWYSVTPGGQGKPAGSGSFFIGNTTETPLSGTSVVRMGVWSFPLPQTIPFTNGGATYNGVRVAENGQFVAVYSDVVLDAPARTGRQVFTFNAIPANSTPVGTQQNRQLASITANPPATFATLGSETIYSPVR